MIMQIKINVIYETIPNNDDAKVLLDLQKEIDDEHLL
jgi:hypothetical protein